MITIALDDEPIALDVIRSLAAQVSFLELRATFTDAFAAMAYLQQEPVELLLLDIRMQGSSSLDLLRSLPVQPLIIFTTAYAEHAVTGFELDAVDYLLKPFSLARFAKACNKALELRRLRHGSVSTTGHLFVKTGPAQVRVRYDDILYLEAGGNYVTFVLENQRLLARMTLLEVLALLPAEQFARVHRSFIVAKAKTDAIERHQVLIRGHQVPISTLYLQQ